MPDILFFKSGSFSHTNEQVRLLLEREFPERQVRTIELLDDVLRHRTIATRNGLSILYHFPDRLLKGEHPGAFYYRTPYMFSTVRNIAARHAASYPDDVAFTFQTQSMFDASVPGLPHFVYTDHTMLNNLDFPAFDPRGLRPRQWLTLEPQVYRNATRVLVMSRHVERSLVRDYGLSAERIRVVGTGFNTPVPERPGGAEPQTILFVGVEWERKGGPELVEAFRRLQPRFPQAKLIIVGASPAVGLPNCQVVGRIPLSEVGPHYRRAGIFCLPSRIEPFGIAYLEAMSHGLPIVAPRLGALPDLIDEEVGGLLTPPGDIDALTEALARLLADPGLARRLGEAGRRRVLAEFTWEATGRRIRAAIRDALAEGAEGAAGAVPPP